MLYPLHARRVFAIGVAVLALSGAAAKADVLYTFTVTGTISSGDSHGIFGANGTNLAGMTYTATQTFDATLSTLNQNGTLYSYLNPATSSANITIGGNTYNISGDTNVTDYYLDSRAGGDTFDEAFGRTYNNAETAFFYADIFTNTLTFLSSDSLSQTLYYAVPSSGITSNSVDFQAPDGTTFAATISTLSLNGGAPVPEPGSVALFGAGLAGLAWFRRRKPA